MFPEAEMLPHLICSRPMFIGAANHKADQHDALTKCVSGGAIASKSPVDLPLRLDDANASPTTPQGQHQ
jgi:hypothetical protein